MTSSILRHSAVRMAARVVLMAVVFDAILIAVAALSGHKGFTVSLVVGFAVAAASFVVLVFFVLKSMDGQRKSLIIAIVGLVKIFVIGIVLWWVINKKIVTPFAFMLGFSSLVAALIVEGMTKKS